MSDSEAPAAPPSSEPEPDLVILTQYVKDLSFENPNAPMIFGKSKTPPKITISVDVKIEGIQERLAEVILALRIDATVGENKAFLIELEYAGIANLSTNLSPEESERALLIEAPAMLFPFARAVVATLSRDGGFMPFLMAPIDFEKMYIQRKEAAEAAPATTQ